MVGPHMDETIQPIAIAIAIVERDDQLLVGTRPHGVPLAGFSEFPGGKVKPGETHEAAAIRECLEETGLRVLVAGEFPSKLFRYDHATVQLRFFRCHVDEADAGQTPLGTFRWFDRGELTNLQFPEANSELIERLQASE